MFKHRLAASLAATVLLALSGIDAAAQAPADTSSNTQSYARGYFDKFNPQTARDLIDRLPGFTLQQDEDLRGFGGSAGNVLIDGARPSSKTGGIAEALQSLPANRVARIDVIRGAIATSEAAGQSVVANIILSDVTSSARWELQVQHPSDGRVNGFADLSLAREIVGWQTATQISGSVDRRPLDGTRISRDADNQLTFFELEDAPSSSNSFTISSEAKRAAFGGALKLSGRFNRRPASSAVQRLGFDDRFPDQVPDQRFTLDVEVDRLNGEFGADWTRTFPGDWSFKLLSLSSYSDTERDQVVNIERPIGAAPNTSIFESDQERFETILRSTYSRTGERTLRPELGLELTYNRLDSELALTIEDAAGASSIALPAANVRVEEVRAEAFANLIWGATPKLTVEAGIAGEVSEITVSGDATNSQAFVFAKPFASVTYDVRQGVQLRGEVRRSVGQLDFTDFAASASAADDRLLAGNPELGPDQTVRAALSSDLRSRTGHALNIEAFHEWRSDILEQSLLPSGVSGLANTGSARLWGVKADASLPLSPFIPGGLLEVEAEFRNSTFDDLITGMPREISDTDSPTVLVAFRQDLTRYNISWGVSYRPPLSSTFFFTDEESFNRDGRFWSAFIETTRFAGLKATLEFSGIGAQNFLRERRFFTPDRSEALSGSQIISRDRGMFVNFTLSGQF